MLINRPIQPAHLTLRATAQAAGQVQRVSATAASAGLGRDQLTLSAKAPAKPPATPPAKVPSKGPTKPVQPAPKPAPKPPAPVEPPVAETPEAAVAAALRGEPIRISLPKGEPRGLAMRVTGREDGRVGFQVALGKESFSLSVPEQQSNDAVLVRVFNAFSKVPDALRAPITAVRVSDATPETLAFQVDTQSLDGKPATVAVRRTGESKGKSSFELTVNGDTIQVLTQGGGDLPYQVAQLAAFYAQVPERFRQGVLKTVELDNGPNPLDAYWEKTYNLPGFSSAASASSGLIQFWNGSRNLWDDYFLHEFGHLIGQVYSTDNNYTPDGWEEAMQADAEGQSVSNYAKASPDEDFAETFQFYVRLSGGKNVQRPGMENLAAFEALYPHRTAVIKAILDGTTKPIAKKLLAAA